MNFTKKQKKHFIALIISAIITTVAILSFFVPIISQIVYWALTFLLCAVGFALLFAIIRTLLGREE